MTALPDDIRSMAAAMAGELRRQQLDVTLVPAPRGWERGRKVRVVAQENPSWYRDLCAAYPSTCRSHNRRIRKADTIIKRQHVLAALDRIAAGKAPVNEYDQRLLPFIEEEIELYAMADMEHMEAS